MASSSFSWSASTVFWALAASLALTQAQAQTPPPPPPASAHSAPCSVCGRVEAVHKIGSTSSSSGVGAVAGGVVGGVLGHQVGNGRGRTLATVAGAAGGAAAGNAVERNRNTQAVFRVSVRMQDGSLRTVDTPTAPHVGQSVTVKGNTLR